MATRIEWCDETWNPLVGCSPVSRGCEHCYAAMMASRHLSPQWRDDRGQWLACRDDGVVRWTGRVRLLPERLGQPLGWRRSRRIFVCSMGDLFHAAVSSEYIKAAYGVMALCPQHEFVMLTKRPRWALAWFNEIAIAARPWDMCYNSMQRYRVPRQNDEAKPWPPTNVTLGVSVFDQKSAEEGIYFLLLTPAVRRIVSVEPMLGPVDLADATGSSDVIRGVICGAETGPGARPMELDWARSLRDQCQAAGVPFFFKRDSDGRRELDGRRWEEWAR